MCLYVNFKIGMQDLLTIYYEDFTLRLDCMKNKI